MGLFDVSPTTTASGRIRELVRRIAVDVFDATEVEIPIPGFTVFTDRKLDDPLAGLRAALLLRNVGEAQLYEYARTARAAGRSWDEVAKALDLSTDGLGSAGETAFDWLVVGRVPEPDPEDVRSFRTPSAYWRCGSCDQLITDDGPFESHPDDQEGGHARGCARHLKDIAAWRERTGRTD
ncbi:hypothetical protein ACIGG9_18255 [Pseudonocardia alni]|jgi:hypothetical protein|uniref:hypothetical protein n=1 Tax=Pseudonocardia alni TaxID=33907 RepID=UPI0033F5CB63